MSQLNGKTALVTGGTSGIGLATAQRFAAEGAHVFITGRRQAQLDAAVAAIGSRVTGIRADVTVSEDMDRVFEAISARGGGLDVLFANAGGGEFGLLVDLTPEHVSDAFNRNVAGTVFTVQKALPVLNEGASILLAGSTAASNGTPAFSVYAASKAAIRSFGRTWAAELADRGIRVNTLIPGTTETPGLVDLFPDADAARTVIGGMAEGIPMKRVAHPSEIANAALFLASDQSSFMTGGEIFVDGGAEQI
ncbi:SDR family NAD(P)-dependent oxidoreductase [Streptomyces bobili]|uniref:SDR family NAD(P)-dependent oxidoreductase n=1 Tax=Streptomyces bobili TaxID=67280 RepID=UPI0037BBC07E